MPNGFIYIMTNPALPGMVKIGFAKDVERRRRELSTTALPYDYEIYATYETSGNLEDKKLHRLIDSLNPDLRVSKNREFFLMSPEEAFQMLEAIATISGTAHKLGRTVVPIKKEQTLRRPPIDFIKCGIPIGAELVCTEDPSIRVTVESPRKVLYQGEITSLSGIMDRLHGYPTQGPAFFTYNGRLITDVAEETQWKNL